MAHVYLEDDPEQTVYARDEWEAADDAASPCPHCQRSVRWVRNLGGRYVDSRILIEVVERPRPAAWAGEEDSGMIAVTADGAGQAVDLVFLARDDSLGARLYPCHWDTCDQARAERDIRAAQRQRSRFTRTLRARVSDAPPRWPRRG